MMICHRPSQIPVRVISSVAPARSEPEGKDLWSGLQKFPHFVRDDTACGREGEA
jgi:hypothetical protein